MYAFLTLCCGSFSMEMYSCTKIMKMNKANLRKTNANTEIYVKKSERKKIRRERSQYDNGDYISVSLEC